MYRGIYSTTKLEILRIYTLETDIHLNDLTTSLLTSGRNTEKVNKSTISGGHVGAKKKLYKPGNGDDLVESRGEGIMILEEDV